MRLLVILLVVMLCVSYVCTRKNRNRPRKPHRHPKPPKPHWPPMCKHVMLSPIEKKAKIVLRCAIAATSDAIRTSRKRRQDGIDVSFAKQTVLTPAVMSGGDNDLSSLVNPSMMFNNLNYCIEKHGFQLDIPTVIQLVENQKCLKVKGALIKCPYQTNLRCANNMKYRLANGMCNNLAKTWQGGSRIPLSRFMDPVYEACGAPREHGVGGGLLPSARLVSTTVHTVTSSQPPVTTVTSLFTGFGQFLSHDVTNTPTEKGDKGVPINCCGTPNPTRCFNIDIPAADPFYAEYHRRCMPFTRSAEGTDVECKKGVRQQTNMATSFVDGSTVYGDNDATTHSLREFKNGQMVKSMTDLFPIGRHQNAYAGRRGFNLFKAGDPKTNESPQLFSNNLLFHRAHNKIAKALGILNSAWNDEMIFQETRRIIIAIIQHIVYNEYLPAALSSDVMTRYGLRSLSSGYSVYEPSVDPTLSNVASTVALRFGHSMVNNDHAYADRNHNIDQSRRLTLVDAFFKPLSFLVREMDVNRGQTATPSEDCDRKIVNAMRNRMFETNPGNGLDIASLNIQRGRDHGIASYSEWRKHYGLHAPNLAWSTSPSADVLDFPHFRLADIQLFKNVYASPLDIDVWSAGVTEKPVAGKAVGPLFAEMLADQFSKLKKGDRFWYETGDQQQRFTTGQLQELRKVTMARLLCDHLDIISIQENPFLLESASNLRVQCSNIPAIDLSKW